MSVLKCISHISQIEVTTIQDVRLELAWEEGHRIAAGEVPRHKVTTIGFFTMGFDIKEQQCIGLLVLVCPIDMPPADSN